MSEAARTSMRTFWHGLPREGKWLLSSTAFQLLGRGLTLPFTIIYLHEVRHISLDVAGVLMSVIFAIALVLTGPAGTLTDRWGGRVMVILGSTAQFIGVMILAFATTVPQVVVACIFMGICQAGGWSAFNVLISSIVEGPARQQYFGVNFALVNLGIGVGGLIGGVYVNVSRPETFTTIYVLDALSMLVPIGLMLGPLRHTPGRGEAPEGEPAHAGTYAAILRRPGVLGLTLLTFMFAFVGYGQMEAGFPAFAREVSEVSTRVVGWAFAVNTAVIVVFQFYALRRIEGHRRTRVLVVMAAIWGASWLLLGATGLVPGTVTAAASVLLFHALFASGETLLQPTIPAITNDLSPAHLRGRYNALNSGAFQVGGIIAPVVAGVLLKHDLGGVFIAMLVVACVGLGAMALGLERRIPPSANGAVESAAAGLEAPTPSEPGAAFPPKGSGVAAEAPAS